MNAPESELTWSLDVHPEEWLLVPTDSDERWRGDAAAQVLSALSALASAESDDVPVDDTPSSDVPSDDVPVDDRLTELVGEAIDRLNAFGREMGPDIRVVAALGVPEHTPVPVMVTVAPVDDDLDLLQVCGATQGRSFDAPRVEYLELGDGDSDGVRVTRADIDSRAAVWMTVSLGVRTELVDVVIRWRTTDLAIVPEMTDRLDDLLASIHVQPVTEGQLT